MHETAQDARVRTRRPVIATAVAGAVLAAAAVVCVLASPDPEAVYGEGGVIEIGQVVLLAGGGVGALVRAFRARWFRERMWRVWLGVVALLVIAREFDLHTLLNPETLGSLGVRYRLDWWTDPAVPAFAKLAWGVTGLAIAAAVVLPILFAKPRPVAAVRQRRAHALLLLAAAGFYFAGYLADDILGRGLLVSKPVSKTFEEVAEGLGAICFLSACWAATVRPAESPDDSRGAGRVGQERRRRDASGTSSTVPRPTAGGEGMSAVPSGPTTT